MSVSAAIDWMGGRLAGSNGRSAGAGAGPATPPPSPLVGEEFAARLSRKLAPISASRDTSRLRRDQRDKKFSGSLIDPCPSRLAGGAPSFPDRRGRARV